MKRYARRLRCAAMISLAMSFPVLAQVTVKDAWVRATVPAQSVTGAFMQITSRQDTRLVAVESAAAGITEIHEMSMEKEVMKMRARPDGVALPAGKSVEFKPGGYHLMLMDLKQVMKEGDSVQLTLVIEDKNKKRSLVEVKAVVKALASP